MNPVKTLKPGDRVRIVRGELEGRTGVIVDAQARRDEVSLVLQPSPIRTKMLALMSVSPGHHAVKVDGGVPFRIFPGDHLVELESTHPDTFSGSLVDYLGRISMAASMAPGGRWAFSHPSIYGAVVTDDQPFDDGYGGKLIAESCSPDVGAYLVATQPRAVLSLIAKLREAISLLDRAGLIALGALAESRAPGEDELEKRLMAFLHIEVPR